MIIFAKKSEQTSVLFEELDELMLKAGTYISNSLPKRLGISIFEIFAKFRGYLRNPWDLFPEIGDFLSP